MLAFPQLSSSAIAQFPNMRGQRYRTRIIETAGGVVYRLGDDRAQTTVWTLPLGGVTTPERAAIDSLFLATEGRLRTFTFLDPNDNLVAYSSGFAQGVWMKQSGVVLTAGQLDPHGGMMAVRVTNPTTQPRHIYQDIGAPGNYQYCFSIYMNGSVGNAVELLTGPESDLRMKSVPVGDTWVRVESEWKSSVIADSVRVGVHLPPMTEIVLFGAQLEAGVAAGSYKDTEARSGVYSRCRFVEDELRWTVVGPGEQSANLSVVTVNQ